MLLGIKLILNMKKPNQKSNFIVSIVFLFAIWSAAPVHAADYPELTVIPRASETVKKEAETESKNNYLIHWAIQAPAVATLLASALHQATPKYDDTGAKLSSDARLTGFMVSAGWIVGTLGLSAFYHPYQSSLSELGKQGGSSARDQLLRERMAEHGLKAASRVGTLLRYASGITLIGANVFLLAEADGQHKAFPAVAAGLSLVSLFWCHPWERNYREQMSYRKRVYGVVSNPAVLSEPATGNLVPGFQLALVF